MTCCRAAVAAFARRNPKSRTPFQRIIGVFSSPGCTFASIVRRPDCPRAAADFRRRLARIGDRWSRRRSTSTSMAREAIEVADPEHAARQGRERRRHDRTAS